MPDMTEHRRVLGWALAAAVLLPSLGARAQTQTAAGAWTSSRTAWGDPDLQGVWSFATITPLERPVEFAARERLTEARSGSARTGGPGPWRRCRLSQLQRVLEGARRIDRANRPDRQSARWTPAARDPGGASPGRCA